MMTAPRNAYAEERDDPRNALLGAFDAMIVAMKDNGLEAPMRALIGRHFPLHNAGADLFDAGDKRGPLFLASAEEELQAQIALSSFKACSKIKLNGHAHQAIARAVAWLEQQLEESRQARAAA